jgi:hypothetical protein
MNRTRLEKSEMLAVQFCQRALQEKVAPATVGSVKERIQKAARRTGWSYNRTRDVWYADPRVSIKADELVKVEALSGLEYLRREVRTNEEIIARADALLDGPHADFFGPFVAAMRAAVGLRDRT